MTTPIQNNQPIQTTTHSESSAELQQTPNAVTQNNWLGSSTKNATPNNPFAGQLLAQNNNGPIVTHTSANQLGGVTLTTTVDLDGNGQNESSLTSAFDESGNIRSNAYTMDRSGDGVVDYGEAYTYDSNGRVTGHVVVQDTDHNGTMDTQSHTQDRDGNGVLDTQTTVVYDDNGNMSSRSVAQDINEDGIMDFAFNETFDAQGNRTSYGATIFEDGMLASGHAPSPQEPDDIITSPTTGGAAASAGASSPSTNDSAASTNGSTASTDDSTSSPDNSATTAVNTAPPTEDNTSNTQVYSRYDIQGHEHAAYLIDQHGAFDSINRGGKRITRADLRQAAKNENLPPEVRAAADYLAHNYQERRELERVNDDGKRGARGDRRISSSDISQAAQGYTPPSSATSSAETQSAANVSSAQIYSRHDIQGHEHAAYLIDHYGAFDSINRGGKRITRADLRQAAKNENLPPEVRAAADYLAHNYQERRELERVNDDGKRGARGDRRISSSDISQAAQGYTPPSSATSSAETQSAANVSSAQIYSRHDIQGHEHAAYLIDHYGAFDSINRGGKRITRADLRQAAKNENLPPEVRAAADYLAHNYQERRELERVNDDGKRGTRGDRRISDSDIAQAAQGYTPTSGS